MKIENLRFSNSQMKFARIENFHGCKSKICKHRKFIEFSSEKEIQKQAKSDLGRKAKVELEKHAKKGVEKQAKKELKKIFKI